jgi:hypothetical protein
MGTAATNAALFTMRKNSRSRRLALALTRHQSGLTVTGVDVTGSTATADYVQDDNGNGLTFVALTSGFTGSTPLNNNEAVTNDGGVTWQYWAGRLLVAPNTPSP